MILTLIRKEIVSHVLSLRFLVVFILVMLLVFAAFFFSGSQYRRQRDLHVALKREYDQRLDKLIAEQEGWDLHRQLFWSDGRSQVVYVPELSSLAVGLAPLYPAGLTVTASDFRSESRAEYRNPLLGLFQTLDIVYAVQVLVSLMAMLLVFDMVCGEKETGTLRLMLSYPVPRYEVLISKWLGGLCILFIPLLIAAFGGVVYLWGVGLLSFEPQTITRLVMIGVVAGLYVSAFFTVGLFFSTVTHRSATALLLSLTVWVAMTLVIPNLASVVAKVIAPTPTHEKIASEKVAIDKEIDLRIERLQLLTGSLSYGESTQRDREKLEQEGELRKRKWDSYYQQAVKRQIGWAQGLGRCSPAAAWVYAATELTGTGLQDYLKFKEARQRMQKQMSEVARRSMDALRRDEVFDLQQELPVLNQSKSDISISLDAALNDILVLIILNVLFFMSSFAAFLRYDVK